MTIDIIIEDIINTVPQDEIAVSLCIENDDNIRENILRKIYEQQIEKIEGLVNWINDFFSKGHIIKILDKLNVRYNKQANRQDLISKWLEYRKYITLKPKARPLELINYIIEIATQLKTTPDKFAVGELLIPFLQCLMRYIGFYYATEIFNIENINDILKSSAASIKNHDINQNLEKLSFQQLCMLLSHDTQIKVEPYDSTCKTYIKLSDDNTNAILYKLSNFNIKEKDGVEFCNLVIMVMEYWISGKEYRIVPKGAVVTEVNMRDLGNQLTCFDEDQKSFVINGFHTVTKVGYNLLVASSFKDKIWMSYLRPLPDNEVWITPIQEKPIDLDNIPTVQNTKKRNKVFISYNHKNNEWNENLLKHLQPLADQHNLEIWTDRKIDYGDNWRVEIQNALQSTKIAILLITPAFFLSEFIIKYELPIFLEDSIKYGIRIIPVIIELSIIDQYAKKLLEFQTCCTQSQPLCTYDKNNREAKLIELSEDIINFTKENK